MDVYGEAGVLVQFLAMKHERGTRGAALASDVVGRGDARGIPLPARPAASHRVMPRGFWSVLADSRRRGSDSGQFALNRADSRRRDSDSDQLTLNRADSGRIDLNQPYRPIQAKIQKKKKKKKV